MYEKLYKELDDLYDRLEKLEGCEDNPVYKKEIGEIKDKITELNGYLQTEFF